ncbi:MAG: bifunctional [glutamate--ammonia ligase]-adenylyl-L-tyrosine phosphorylase/[glutamate--ammonia-ligase] adenylyltransferase [Pseudomonadales bacterium]|jgi:[glutamine synthetase] adenylyltransferase / [glutamine synthetase]-adenylyl-L-tyrosine phosphorylase|nr:bifunctional [glutamate--ammonia ligase]-adenylyl-L-tyrosine phosphorylase/[glutamate--ammonia-ligase] adenylyltransferase [Pseudomonadales bacterium]TNC88261.1 MAG: bifunctional [glutamate--ammonia ligase]-adenylyl-L-tyrosine phosphorylase/[glutamate--ammonia-ligase] adenylyltransferase [Alcanivorax sp.]HAG96375.1 bifunctional [glutamate--ammonia ligase]-adenylyl-L-tyrosine phosphorylase/[glutamate--ammonia-ligase] adenylyltransferase [Gammaproteobacteria bacterium]MAQ26185.1 bifunctional [g|tara:strand:+ start:9640 stop:12582 length:2943 start_codon:yes stop_codon:yes gene_type:complete
MTLFAPERFPDSVQPALQPNLDRLQDAFAEADLMAAVAALDTQTLRQLEACVLASDYVVDQLVRYPRLLLQLVDSGDLLSRYGNDRYRSALQTQLAGAQDEAALARVLRQFRRREMVRIIWRDSCGLADFQETVGDLSHLADACIDGALDKLYGWMEPEFGLPYYHPSPSPSSQQGQPMPMVVLGMGKLGACELNLSSDIDLMFAYAHEGETRGGRRSLAHRDFFTRLGQKLIKALDENTVDGFVFRVDMRLRPYGSSGALALNFRAMESYYEEQGREWERYAMIKARAIGSDNGDGDELLRRLRPFVYRRYVDFGVIESLRELKKLINQEVLRKGNEDNVKTGAGGIREVEFIAQVFQLIRGGQDVALQQRNLMQVMGIIRDLELLPAAVIQSLCDDYVLLRNVEHRIQALQDRQTQLLPTDPLQQARIAVGMGYADWAGFYQVLGQARQRVRSHFDALIAAPQDQDEVVVRDQAVALWMTEQSGAEGQEDLQALGFRALESSWHLLHEFRTSRQVTHQQAVGRERLDKLMPMLINACAQQADPDLTLQRVLRLVEAILRRSAYIALLVENPHSLERLAMLFAASPWVADTIARYPMLLDTLLNEATLLNPLDVDTLKNELRQVLLRIPEDDLERQMDALRQFKHSHVLRVAASEIAETLPLMKVSDYLTWLAETLLQAVLELAWHQMVDKYGRPTRADGTPCEQDFIIVGYGKVGGIELSYSSDLDLVFIHDADSSGVTDGDKSIDNNVFFARLGQRIIHILTSKMASGELYETDMRLRPSGNSGLLVSSLKAFQDYQENNAWNWEHQALVRARVVAGCPRLARRFAEVREAVLSRPRDEAQLRQEVVAMREKMLGHLSTYKELELNEARLAADCSFDLKQDPGGIVDIEFLAQYLVLRWSAQKPAMTRWTDNMRILDSALEQAILSAEQVTALQNAYLLYRSQTHALALQHGSGKVSAEQFVEQRRQVREIWRKTFN